MGISILTLSLSAKYFGVSLEKDAWLLAMNCILVLDMALWGPINETFRAKFVFFREEVGENNALMKTNSLLVLTNAITILIVAVVMWKPELIANVIAPSYSGRQLALLLFMIRVIAPSFLFNQLSQIFISILNAYHSIYIPEIASFVSGIVSLGLIIFLAPRIGILSLAYSYYFGLIFLLLLLIYQLIHKRINLLGNFKDFKLSGAKPFILFAIPFFFPYFVGQIALILEKAIASSLGMGVVSIIDYSRKFSDIILSVLSSIFTTILVPVLSLKHIQRDTDGFISEFRQLYQLGFLIMTAVAAFFTACPQVFVAILYQRGSITPTALAEISQMTMFYSWSAVAIFTYSILGMSLIAANMGKVYALYGVCAQILMIVINLSLNKTFGIYVFPLSLFLSHTLASVMMFINIPYGNQQLKKVTFKYSALMIFIIVTLYLLNQISFGNIYPYFILLANGIILMVLIVLSVFLLKLDERLILLNLFSKISRRANP